MLKKTNKLLAVLLAVAFAITTFGSDFSFSYARVFAADEENAGDLVPGDSIATAEWETVPEAENKEGEEPKEEGVSDEANNPEASNNENNEGVVQEDSASAEAQVQDPVPAETTPAEGTVVTEETPVSGSTIIPEEDVAKESSAAASSASTSEDAATESSSDDAASLASSDVEAATDASSEASSDAASTDASDEKKSYPAQKFEAESIGIMVEAQAEEGVFPAGTTMKVKAISDIEAMDTAKEALGDEVQQAKGVDISFYNAEGQEIEPSDSKSVHVSISLSNKLSGEEFTVIHQDDAGNTEKVAKANSDGASFDANAFSVYIVAGSGNSGNDTTDKRAICTYNFYLRQSDYDNKSTPFSVQMVKEGDKLANPGVPDNLLSDEEFLGWFAVDGSTIPYGTVGHVTANAVVDVIAKIQTTYYLTYIGVDGEVVYVKKKVFVTGESTMVEVNDISTQPKKETQTFLGWTKTQGSKDLIGKDEKIDITSVKTVYAVASEIHWINFDGNGNGATYTDPIYVVTGESPFDKQPVPPTRKGYTFGGWYTKQNGVGKVKGAEFNWNKVYKDSDKDITLYAKWDPATEADYTIMIWKQSIDDDINTSKKTYDYYGTISGNDHMGHLAKVGTQVQNSVNVLFKPNELLNEKGFHFSNRSVGTRVEDGKIVQSKTIRAEEDTIVNVYFDRDEMTIKFMLSESQSYNGLQFKGYYEQPLSMYNYVWPEGPWIFKDVENMSAQYDVLNLDFLDSFIFTTYTNGTLLYLYKADPTGAHTNYHYFYEQLDGTYKEDTAHMTSHYGQLGAKFEFYCDDYYRGFKPDHYKRYGDDTEYTMASKTLIEGYYTDDDTDDIYLYFHRLSAKIEFMDNFLGNTVKIPDNEVNDIYDSILYQMPLDGSFYNDTTYFSGNTPDLSGNPKYAKPGYEFVGWSKDPIGVDANGTNLFKWEGEMPLNNIILYAVYRPITCKVILDPDGGTITGTKTRASVNKVQKQYPITVSGDKGQIIVDYSAELEKIDMMASVKKDGFEFLRWQISGEPYGYGEILTDITLVALWRRPGTVKVIYIDNVADPHWDSSGTGLPSDNYIYAVGSSAVVGAVPDKVEAGWAFTGWKIQKDSTNILRFPNSSIDIKESYLQKNIPGYDSSYEYVVLEAQYDARKGSSIDPEYTKITYHSNNGYDYTVVVDTGASGLLKVNEMVLALSNDTDTKFTRPGYVFRGWSKVPGDNNPLFVLPGGKIAADNDGIPNDLYAIWETEGGDNPPDDPPPPPYDPPPTPPDNPPSTPTPTPVAAGQVLGARRDTGNGAAVLGARRSRTDDTSNLALRVLAIIAAGAIAAALLITSRKKEEQKEE